MPEIEINGEKKKIACGPCIRGHRSSKCTHKDRVLIEVRKPGRPLSACPHPTGSCSCERMVVNYTLPKTSQCSCTPTPAPAPTPSSGPASGRVQKGKARRSAASLNARNLQRAFSTDGGTTHDLTDCSAKAPSVPVSVETSCCGGAGNHEDAGPEVSDNLAGTSSPVAGVTAQRRYSTQDPSRLRLGMFGVSGARIPDDIGWTKSYPNMYGTPYEQNGVSSHLTTSLGPSPKASTENGAATASSCCGPRSSDTGLNGISPAAQLNEAPSAHPQHPSGPGIPTPDLLTAPASGHDGPHSQQQLPQLVQEQNGYDSTELEHTLHTPISRPVQTAQIVETSPPSHSHTCSCGEGCDCLACLTHPYNKTTLEYVRYHTDLSMRFDETTFHSHTQSHVRHSSDGNTASLQPAVNGTAQANSQGGPFVPWLTDGPGSANVPMAERSWPSPAHTQATPTQELEQLHLRSRATEHDSVQRPLREDNNPASHDHTSAELPTTPAFAFQGLEATSAFDGNSPHASEDTPTLSPSSFFLQSYTMPGCVDATGTCQCGDGCTCDGCLTHTGHQQVQPPPQTMTPYASHGPGCACPHPERTQGSTLGRGAVQNAPMQHVPTAYTNGTHITGCATFTPSQNMNGVAASPGTNIHGPNCACPVDTAVIQAQAQVQAHAQLHGPHCRCPTGMVFLNAQLQAEARLHNQIHGDQASGWIAGPPG